MNTTTILDDVTKVFHKVLENDKIILKRETVASDVTEWDSFNHIQLIVAVEKNFGIRFTSLEIQGFQNVGEMIDCLEGKLLKK